MTGPSLVSFVLPLCVASLAAHVCPSGRYSLVYMSAGTHGGGNASSAEQPHTLCEVCPAGKHWVWHASQGNATCVPCAPGRYMGVGDAMRVADKVVRLPRARAQAATECRSCPSGQISPLPGSERCDDCPAGYMQLQSGQSACFPCPSGRFRLQPFAASNAGAASAASPSPTPVPRRYCSLCPAGTFAPAIGALRDNQHPPGANANATLQQRVSAAVRAALGCLPCAPGQHSLAGAAACVRCDRGLGMAPVPRAQTQGEGGTQSVPVLEGWESAWSGTGDAGTEAHVDKHEFDAVGRAECQLWRDATDVVLDTNTSSAADTHHATAAQSDEGVGFLVIDTAGVSLPEDKDGALPILADMYAVQRLEQLLPMIGQSYSRAEPEPVAAAAQTPLQLLQPRKLPVRISLHGQISLEQSRKRSLHVRLLPVPAPAPAAQQLRRRRRQRKHTHRRTNQVPKLLSGGAEGEDEHRDWIVYGPYSDKSAVRNMLAYGLSNAAGLRAPRTKMVELVLLGGGGSNPGSDATVEADQTDARKKGGTPPASVSGVLAVEAARLEGDAATLGLPIAGGGAAASAPKREGGAGDARAQLREVAAWGPRLRSARRELRHIEARVRTVIEAALGSREATEEVQQRLHAEMATLQRHLEVARTAEVSARWWERRAYRGLYILTEKIRDNGDKWHKYGERTKRRVRQSLTQRGMQSALSAPLVPTNAAFVLRADKMDEGDAWLRTSITGLRVLPNVMPHKVTHAEAERVRRVLDRFEAALFVGEGQERVLGQQLLEATQLGDGSASAGVGRRASFCAFGDEAKAVTASESALDMIDSRSFIDYFLLQELARNVDGMRWSTYFSLQRSGLSSSARGAGIIDVMPTGGKPSWFRLFMGPAWDFNIAFGNARHLSGDEPNGRWLYQNYVSRQYAQRPLRHVGFWYQRLFEIEDGAFARATARRWFELRGMTERQPARESSPSSDAGAWSDDALEKMVVQLVTKGALSLDVTNGHADAATSFARTSDAMQRNFLRWFVLDRALWPNPEVAGSYGMEVHYLLSFLLKRAHWMDEAVQDLRFTNSPASLALRYRFANVQLLQAAIAARTADAVYKAKLQAGVKNGFVCQCPAGYSRVRARPDTRVRARAHVSSRRRRHLPARPNVRDSTGLAASFYNLPSSLAVNAPDLRRARDSVSADDDGDGKRAQRGGTGSDDDDDGDGVGLSDADLMADAFIYAAPRWGSEREQSLLLRDPAWTTQHKTSLVWFTDTRAQNRKSNADVLPQERPTLTNAMPAVCNLTLHAKRGGRAALNALWPFPPMSAEKAIGALDSSGVHSTSTKATVGGMPMWGKSVLRGQGVRAGVYAVLREVEPPGDGWLGDGMGSNGKRRPRQQHARCAPALTSFPAAIVTASRENRIYNAPGGGEIVTKLFDGQRGTKWLAQAKQLLPRSALGQTHSEDALRYGAVAWAAIRFDAVEERYPRVLAYYITSGDDFYGRDPAAWTLQGWVPSSAAHKDGKMGKGCWLDLDTRIGERFSGRHQRRRFCVSEARMREDGFSAYRLLVRKLRDPSAGAVQMTEWVLEHCNADQVAPKEAAIVGHPHPMCGPSLALVPMPEQQLQARMHTNIGKTAAAAAKRPLPPPPPLARVCRAALGDTARAADWADVIAMPLRLHTTRDAVRASIDASSASSGGSDDDDNDGTGDGNRVVVTLGEDISDSSVDPNAEWRAEMGAHVSQNVTGTGANWTDSDVFGGAFELMESVGALPQSWRAAAAPNATVVAHAQLPWQQEPLARLLLRLHDEIASAQVQAQLSRRAGRAPFALSDAYARAFEFSFFTTFEGLEMRFMPTEKADQVSSASDHKRSVSGIRLVDVIEERQRRRAAWSSDVGRAAKHMLREDEGRHFVAVATVTPRSSAAGGSALLELGTMQKSRDATGASIHMPRHVLCHRPPPALAPSARHAVPLGEQRAALLNGWIAHPAHVAAARSSSSVRTQSTRAINVTFTLVLGGAVEAAELWLDGRRIITALHPPAADNTAQSSRRNTDSTPSCSDLKHHASVAVSGEVQMSAPFTAVRLEVWQRGQRFLFRNLTQLAELESGGAQPSWRDDHHQSPQHGNTWIAREVQLAVLWRAERPGFVWPGDAACRQGADGDAIVPHDALVHRLGGDALQSDARAHAQNSKRRAEAKAMTSERGGWVCKQNKATTTPTSVPTPNPLSSPQSQSAALPSKDAKRVTHVQHAEHAAVSTHHPVVAVHSQLRHAHARATGVQRVHAETHSMTVWVVALSFALVGVLNTCRRGRNNWPSFCMVWYVDVRDCNGD